MSVAENLKTIRERVDAACERAGREAGGGHSDRGQQDEAGVHARWRPTRPEPA